MDSITHVLTGAVISKAIDDERVGNWGIVTGLVTGYFPDVDFVLGLFNRQFYIQYHRDFTHSLILIPFYAIFFGWLFKKLSKRNHFWVFFTIALSSLLSHVVLDLLTSFGTMIYSPLSEKRYAWDLLFIIDLTFSGIIFFPFLVSIFSKQKGKWVCRGSIVAASLYILFCLFQHQRAVESGERFSKNLKEEVLQIASLPQPVSPFRWAIYVETKENIYQGFIDFKRKEVPIDIKIDTIAKASFFERLRLLNHLYYPEDNVKYQSWKKLKDSPWVEKALHTEGIKFYYWFARFPVVRAVNSDNGRHRVEFMDLRFFVSGLRTSFVYFIEFDESGKILSEGFIKN